MYLNRRLLPPPPITVTVQGDSHVHIMKENTFTVTKGSVWKTVKQKAAEKITGYADGYLFSAWKLEKADGEVLKDDYVFEKNTVVFAVAKPNTQENPQSCKIEFSVDGSGGTLKASVDGGTPTETSPVIVPSGASVTLTAKPDNGFVVEKWTGIEAGATDTVTIANITKDTTVTVTFKSTGTTLEANGLPRVYDLRKEGGVTPIKNQYKDGGCRSFASLAALESHIKIKEDVELDLSENNMEMRHGFYFMGKKTREGRNRESDIPYLINGLGPILEADDPYTPMQDSNGQKPEYLTRAQVDALTIVSNKPCARLVMGFQFLKKVDTKNLTSEEDEKLVQIKTAIKEHGAVVSNIYMAHDGNGTFPYSNATYYNPVKCAYYADGKDGKYTNGANHAITIVGWNDNFSKDNFTTKPPIDGAWIVKDAQTEDFGEHGFFYVSFASVSMGTDAYVFTDVCAGNAYAGIYQHDEVAFSSYLRSDFFTGKTVLFNRYEPKKAGQVLKEIGFYTTKPNAEYEVYLIKDFDAFKTTAGTYDDEDEFYTFIQEYKIFSGTEETAGYHTKKLEGNELALTKDKAFALGIWTKNDASEDPNHKWDMVIERKDNMGVGKKAKVNTNETFVFDSTDGFMDMNQYSTSGNGTGNACIKGYYIKD